MNVAHLLDKARLMGVTLRLDGQHAESGRPAHGTQRLNQASCLYT